MSRFMRASKVRHVFGSEAKKEESFHDLTLSSAMGEHNYIKANSLFFAVSTRGGGGSVLVHPMNKPGKIPMGAPTICGHRDTVYDFDFSPFNQHILATGSGDSTIKVWEIPEGGLTENMTESVATLEGHGRKVTLVQWHPTAENVLASASADFSVKVWNVEDGTVLTTLAHEKLLQDLKWSWNGSLLATSSKDKTMRVWNPRTGDIVGKARAHDGAKGFKVEWLGTRNQLVTVGFGRMSDREFKIWNVDNLDEPVSGTSIDQGSGMIMPFYDTDSSLLFFAGKGDGTIRYYEVVDDKPWHFHVADYHGTSTKGLAMLPRRFVDTSKNEIARFVQLQSSAHAVVPISFVVPRRSDAFQEDLYPNVYAGRPALSASAWCGGEDKDPVLVPVKPGGPTVAAAGGGGGGGGGGASSPSGLKSRVQLKRELAAAMEENKSLKEQVESLKAELAAAKGE